MKQPNRGPHQTRQISIVITSESGSSGIKFMRKVTIPADSLTLSSRMTLDLLTLLGQVITLKSNIRILYKFVRRIQNQSIPERFSP